METMDYLLNLLQKEKEKSKMCVMIGSGGRGKSILQEESI